MFKSKKVVTIPKSFLQLLLQLSVRHNRIQLLRIDPLNTKGNDEMIKTQLRACAEKHGVKNVEEIIDLAFEPFDPDPRME
jgi:hypothetical protein